MRNFLNKAWLLYYDGFRGMTVGRTLWLIIGIKVFIFFVILKIFFFPSMLSGMDDVQKAEHITNELISR